ncbi:MAG: aconitate hydratase AcnA [Chloroflexi bacterium]|nr:aconitate hydratase AcnA [Chloroflexota bacterium]
MSNSDLHAAARSVLQTAQGPVTYYDLHVVERAGLAKLDRLPFSIRVLLENMLRKVDGYLVREEDVATVAGWNPTNPPRREVPFMPARVLLQDLTGVPVVVDLAAMRSAMVRSGGDPKLINPLVPADLVIDHSVQVDFFGSELAFQRNVTIEFERNTERYLLLRWAQQAFQNFRVVPPGTGIVHQVNLEYLASVVMAQSQDGAAVAFPDTVVGTDSHTTMINGLSVLGWGVGGIEAEAVLLGQPYYILLPEVIGVRLTGTLRQGVTATDLVLTVTEMLRRRGVVEKFVEFFGPGLGQLPLADRATIANMAPEYGATCGFFPIDEETLRYLRGTGRTAAQVDLVERYARAQGIFRTDATPDPQYSDVLELDMSTVESSLAGPTRPEGRVPLGEVKDKFQVALGSFYKKTGPAGSGEQAAAASTATAVAERPGVPVELDGQNVRLDHGSVVIAAITSCTNTSNPSVMIGAGLLAKKAIERGLDTKPWVKSSMAPGSRVVADYLANCGTMPYLEALGFHIVGYGCTTCIGNSGPLPEAVSQAINEHDIVAAAVISGNRNFEGRVHPDVKANYLASPMLVVAYALAGSLSVDLATDPVGHDRAGQPVYLSDIWPTQEEIRDAVANAVKPEIFASRYGEVFNGDEAWRNLPVPQGDLYQWDTSSTYVQEAPYFLMQPAEVPPLQDIRGARVLAYLGDSITTDHISPAGAIPLRSPAGQFLIARGVKQAEFNTYGARRGNHEVMVRGTFGNIRLKNQLTPNVEGDWTQHLPDGERLRIFDASMQYQAEGTPLVVIAGREYGNGSSRDWAAKGPMLLGVKAVIVESFERIHRSNLVGMGVLPLQFKPGQSAASLGLTGLETYDIAGIADGLQPGQDLTVTARKDSGEEITFPVTCRIDTPVEVDYYRQGGVLQAVLQKIKEANRV